MAEYFLNLATARYRENSSEGLMICGINWGGEADPAFRWTKDVLGESFFSDRRFNNYRYRDRIAKWFALLGHPLAESEAHSGPFERSIVQTNWLRNQSPNMRSKDVYAECIREWGNFEFHLEHLKPRLIMFLSVTLLHALNSRECANGAHHLLGEASPPTMLQRDVVVGDKRLRRFRVGVQRFKNTDVIALPHPSGSKGLCDEYIAAYHDLLSPLLTTYKASRGFMPADAN